METFSFVDAILLSFGSIYRVAHIFFQPSVENCSKSVIAELEHILGPGGRSSSLKVSNKNPVDIYLFKLSN